MDMNLNLGSGEWPMNQPDWVDIDLPWDGVVRGSSMVFADMFTLPFPDNTFSRVYGGHVLEHIYWEELAAGRLDEVWRVCQPGAEVMVVGPCMKRALDQGEPLNILNAIIGAGESGWLYEGPGGHKWVPTEALTARAMRLAGLVEIEPLDVRAVRRPRWPNTQGATWQCALRARVPG